MRKIIVVRTGNRRRAAQLCMALALTSVLAACGSAATAVGVQKTFVIGIDAPLTGGEAASGAQIKDAVTLAFQQAGNHIGDYKIDLVAINDQGDPASGANALEAAVTRQGIQAATGIWDSDVALSEMPIVARAKIPFVFSGAAGQTIVADVRKDVQKNEYWDGNVYSPANTNGAELVTALNHFYQQDPSVFPCGKTAATISEQSDFGYAVVAGAVSTLKADGWTVKAQDWFPIDQANNTAAIEGIERKCVSVIIGNGTATQATTSIVNEVGQTGFKGVVMMNGLGYGSTWYQLTGANSNGVWDIGNVFLKNAAAAKFQSEFKKQFGVAPAAVVAGVYYDYANFFIKVLKATLARYHSLTSQDLWKTMYDQVRTGQLVGSPGVALEGIRYSTSSWPAPVFAINSYYSQVLQYEHGNGNVIWPLNERTANWISPGK